MKLRALYNDSAVKTTYFRHTTTEFNIIAEVQIFEMLEIAK
jgi:hypothetical protein